MIAGQLVGTLFNTEAADELAYEVATQKATSVTIKSTAKTARDMALNARTASRAMQSLPTVVRAPYMDGGEARRCALNLLSCLPPHTSPRTSAFITLNGDRPPDPSTINNRRDPTSYIKPRKK